jgi:DNA-binding transcriptional ArsR family regulator
MATRKNKSSDDLHALVQSLAERLETLERERASSASKPAKATTTAIPGLDAEKYWLLNKLAASEAKGGEVAYGGLVSVPTGEQYMWQRHGSGRELFKLDWSSLDKVLAALGHPVRLQLLQAILAGHATKAELEKLDGIGTTGQLYHHLKALEEGGWIRSLQRGTYSVPGERVVPLLTILLAALG